MSRLVCFVLLIALCQSIFADQVSVRIQNGQVNGFKRPVEGRLQDTFLGIPFAQPPLGELRFKRPLPVESWSEPVDATQWPNPCPHFIMPLMPQDYYNNKNTSEDCLYLNVFSPSVDSDPLKPVLVFIHGGAFTMGSSSIRTYDPYVIVSKGDVVVVTINYRLNYFGFLYTGTEDAPGNVGLYDQALALEWVKDNVAYFGGDPEQITLFGESAGSISVGLHFLSPMTRHLFKNAVMMSAAPAQGLPIVSKEESLAYTKQVAQTVGCGDDITFETIKCLKQIDAKVLESTVPLYLMRVKWVVTGDSFLPEHPDVMLDEGDFKKNTQLIVGTTEDEGSFLLSWFDPVTFDLEKTFKGEFPKVTKELALQTLKKGQESDMINKKADVEAAVKFYLSTIADDDSDALMKQLGFAVGDATIGCPTIEFARRVAEKDPTSRVYNYFWSDKFDTSVDPTETIMLMCAAPNTGACHAHDLMPAFGSPFKPNTNFNDRHRRMSEQFIRMLISLNKDGRPASPIDGVEWPNFYSINNKMLIPVYEFGPTDEKSGFRYNMKDVKCRAIWKV